VIPLRRRPPAPSGQRRRLAPLAALLAIPLIASLGSCRLERFRPMVQPLEGTLYLAVGVSHEALDTELQKEVRQRTALLQSSFRALQPKVRLQVQVFPEENLSNELRVRNRTGLSPDLLIVNESTARELAREKLISTVSFPAEALRQLDRGSVVRVERSDGTLTGVPLDLQPQLACFDRRRVSRSPATLEELLAFSAKGMEVGLPFDAVNLAWTLGPLGALDAATRLMAGTPMTPETRRSLRGWLEWLRMADQQQHITFYPNQTELLDQLIKGGLDWIPCRSITITRLRTQLGRNVGVAPLPAGPHGTASPITQERVMAFGVNSSPDQRRLALALARFAISPLHQRDMILRSQYVLPVNRQISPPVQSSSVIAAMVEGRQQSLRSATIRLGEGSSENQREEWQTLLTRYLFDDLSLEDTLDGLIDVLRRGRSR
jgi:ABC-type glycerol-3-phosphate transport system substrate-binding protein